MAKSKGEGRRARRRCELPEEERVRREETKPHEEAIEKLLAVLAMRLYLKGRERK